LPLQQRRRHPRTKRRQNRQLPFHRNRRTRLRQHRPQRRSQTRGWNLRRPRETGRSSPKLAVHSRISDLCPREPPLRAFAFRGVYRRMGPPTKGRTWGRQP
jgi:hypothetical protein